MQESEPPQGLLYPALKSKLVWITCTYNEVSMAQVADQLTPYQGQFSRVCVCHGLLHSDTLWPEKRLERPNLVRIFI